MWVGWGGGGGVGPVRSYVVVYNYIETSSLVMAKTALQGGLVLAKSGRLEMGDNILRTL